MSKYKNVIAVICASSIPTWAATCRVLYDLGICWHKDLPGRQENIIKPVATIWVSDHGDPLKSIDAALELIKPGHHVIALNQLPESWVAKIGNNKNDRQIGEAECSTAPLAITLAYLRLLEIEEDA